MTVTTRLYYGTCPECGSASVSHGRMGIGGATVGLCWEHAVYWSLGEDQFPRVDEQSDADFARNREKLKAYRQVEPLRFVQQNASLGRLIGAMSAVLDGISALEGLSEGPLKDQDIPRDLAMEWARKLSASVPILKTFNNRLRSYVPTSEDEETRKAGSAAWTLEHIHKLLSESRDLSDKALRNVESLVERDNGAGHA